MTSFRNEYKWNLKIQGKDSLQLILIPTYPFRTLFTPQVEITCLPQTQSMMKLFISQFSVVTVLVKGASLTFQPVELTELK